jgi:sarcosine oxidase, subunit alpha
VNVPARHGRALWEKLWDAGQEYDIVPYGTESMHVMRAEKGYIIVGQDTDGTLTPDDAGLTWAIGKAKPDFVGKRSLTRPDMVAKGRKQLIGLLTDDPKIVLQEGAQIVADPAQPKPMTMLGHVTSSYWSDAAGRSIALAVVADGRARDGETLYVPMPDGTIPVKVVKSTVFLDPENSWLSA